MSNRLADTQSPYLLQHQDNPVDWWPWSEEAFAAAKAQDKPVFLSIGYSTCHWCHVMAHEAFEDDEVARLMNDAFINIKVDREERPDLDNIYMTVCQMMTGHGGWPLTILMTPEKEPFFAGTYIPKHTRSGRVGMVDFVPRVAQAWQQRREKIEASASEIVGILQNAASQPASGRRLDVDYLHVAFAQLSRRFDGVHGGFGSAPKFPSPHNLLFLLRYWKRTGEAEALQMVETTLDKMRLGGVYDHLGFGFHRYATDATWKLPHFEKMLYDQALLAMAYTEAFQATRAHRHRAVTEEIFTYILRDMTAPEGGFYSAEDADSEGREGTFYVWTEAEIRDVLDEDLPALVIDHYNFEATGNFEEEATRQKSGENVLFLKKSLDDLAEDLRDKLEEARAQLFKHREAREHPGKDDKVLTDWNGLMIAALAKAATAFGVPAYCEAARNAALFVLDAMRDEDGRLLHRWRNGEAAIPGNLDDYAFFVWGLLELYEASFEIQFLQEALALNEHLLAHFWDAEHGAFFFAPDDGETLIVRQKEGHDGAIPSGNAIAMMNLLRLSRLTGNTDLEQRADDLGAYFAATVAQQPTGFTALLMALNFALGPSYEIVLAGDPEAAGTRTMLEALWSQYLPNKVVLLRSPEVAPALAQIAPYTEAQESIDQQTTAYVCQHFQCERPVTEVEAFLALVSA